MRSDAADWFGTTTTELWRVPLSAMLIMVVIVVAVRLVGLRSFSKMSAFDFAVTVSMGSLVASVTATTTSLTNGALAVVSLLVFQAALARARLAPRVHGITDNTPLLLVASGRLLHDNLRAARVTEDDVWSKLRLAGVTELSRVHAVVLETTGDISVLHGESSPDPRLLEGVRREPPALLGRQGS